MLEITTGVDPTDELPVQEEAADTKANPIIKDPVNHVSITGVIISGPVISYSKRNEDVFEAEMAVRRSSKTVDKLMVQIPQHLLKNGEALVGNRISAEGCLRSRNIRDEKGSHLRLSVPLTSIAQIDALPEAIEDEECESDENLVQLDGFICKKGPLRRTPLGRRICDIMLAVNRKNGVADYIPCIFWGKSADMVIDYPVGTEILISGRFQSRQYIKSGEFHTTYEVSVQSVQFV